MNRNSLFLFSLVAILIGYYCLHVHTVTVYNGTVVLEQCAPGGSDPEHYFGYSTHV